MLKVVSEVLVNHSGTKYTNYQLTVLAFPNFLLSIDPSTAFP